MENQQLIDSILASMQKDISSLQKLELEPEQVEHLLEMRSQINALVLKTVLSAI
jgi:hypothetical protein